MRVLGLIPARGGSKGIPRKNLRMLCGRPLLEWTAMAALESKRLTRTILSTEDEAIAEAGRRCGLEIPFLRPAELAHDEAPMLPVVEHALRWIEAEGGRYEAICLLQPTNPLRRGDLIDACIDRLTSTSADSVVTFVPVPSEYNPHWVYFPAPDGTLHLATGEDAPIPRRQELPQAYCREGSVYVTRRDVLIDERSLYGRRLVGLVIDPETAVDINEPADLERAERLLRARDQAASTQKSSGP